MIGQVYAILHNGSGEFMIAFKNTQAYFFHQAFKEGVIVPEAEEIPAANQWAFPGGTWEIVNPVQTAIDLFFQQTGVHLDPMVVNPATLHGDGFYAVYFNLGIDFTTYYQNVQQNLAQGRAASNAIQNREFTSGQYNQMMTTFQGCPPDNHLNSVYAWNIRDEIQDINQLKQNPATGYCFDILKNLALQTFGVIILDKEGLAGIGDDFQETSDRQYLTHRMTEIKGGLIPQNIYTVVTRRRTYRDASFISNVDNIAVFKGS